MKYCKFILLFIISFLFVSSVSAGTCNKSDADKLNLAASHVKLTYTKEDNSQYKKITANNEETTYKVPNYTFKISVYNITEDIYINIKDDKTNLDRNIYYSDTSDGVYTIENKDFGSIYKYTVSVYSNVGDCKDTLLLTRSIIKPKYNAYSEFEYCKTSSKSQCQEFIKNDLSIKNEEDFYKSIGIVKKDKKDDNKENKNLSIKEIFTMNKRIYIISAIITAIVVLVIILIINRVNKGSKG